MSNEKDCENLYIVISQTGTVLSRVLKLITGAQYNHASLALYEDLNTMYSFGRKYAHNPFLAGFVTESASYGTFKRFHNTEIKVIAIKIPKEKHNEIENMIFDMLTDKKRYHYNYLGLWLAGLRISFKSQNRYYCSEFVKEVLCRFEIEGAQNLEKIIQPVHFLRMPYIKEIYSGKLKDYEIFCLEKAKAVV